METNKILLAHGSGGKLTHDLIKQLFQPRFNNPILAELTDAAVLDLAGRRLAFTTDSYVIKPLFFPGGDIGKLAVCGTINDLVVMGAKPLYISCGLVIEEGLDYEILAKIVGSMEEAAQAAAVEIVAGDTKVVEKGGADKLFINTTGVGLIDGGLDLSVRNVAVGDEIILSGTLGDHGIAVLSVREGFDFEGKVESDCAALHGLVDEILRASNKVKFMRDPTRGGLATTLNELVASTGLGVLLDESKIPVKAEVGAICELLGFDPLYIANEGKLVVVVASEDAMTVLEAMRGHELGKDSKIIGKIVNEPVGRVGLKTAVGGTRIVDMQVGDQLPRIC